MFLIYLCIFYGKTCIPVVPGLHPHWCFFSTETISNLKKIKCPELQFNSGKKPYSIQISKFSNHKQNFVKPLFSTPKRRFFIL